MIRFVTGDIFDSQADAIVNTVNLVGVMGKGIALQFKERFADNFKLYVKACKEHAIGIGNSLVVRSQLNGRQVWIVNFPTKVHWRDPSQYWYIERGLDNLACIIKEYGIGSIAIPPLGAGNGGLEWEKVKPLIEARLSGTECEILVYEPGHIAESRPRNISLTPARALLTYMLHQLQAQGYDATAFSAVKMAYFLQKFGAANIFRMKFEPYVYGPYCDKVRHLLHGMDGSLIEGFSDMSKKPFEPFGLVASRFREIDERIVNDDRLSRIADRTSRFLAGYLDDFGLELLSSVDFLMECHPENSFEEVCKRLHDWGPRKKRLFADSGTVRMAYEHIMTVTPRLPL